MKIAKIQNSFKINNQTKPCAKQVLKHEAPASKVSFCGNLDSSFYVTGIAKPFFMAIVSKIEPDKEIAKDYYALAHTFEGYSPERALALMNIYGAHKNSNEEILHSSKEYQAADDKKKAEYDKESARCALMLASRTMDLCSKCGFLRVDTSILPVAMNVSKASLKYPDMPFELFSLMCRDFDGTFNPQIAAGIFALADKIETENPLMLGALVEDYCMTPQNTLDTKALDIVADIYNTWGEKNAHEFIDLALDLKKDKMDQNLAKITIDMLEYFDDCDCDIEQFEEEAEADEDDFDEENWHIDFQSGDEFWKNLFGDDMWHTRYQAGSFEEEFEGAPRLFDDFCDHEEIENDDMDFDGYPKDDEFSDDDEEMDYDNIKLNDDYVAAARNSIQKMINLTRDKRTGEADLAKFEEIFNQIKEDSGADFNEFLRIMREEY